MTCIRMKTECRSCRNNHDGLCVIEDKPVEDIYNKWFKTRRRRVLNKLNDNKESFKEYEIGQLLDKMLDGIDIYSKDCVIFLNDLKEVMQTWKYIDVDFLEEDDFGSDWAKED